MSSRGETRISAMAMAQVNYVNLRRESYMVLGMAVKAMDEEQAPEQVSSSGGHQAMHAGCSFSSQTGQAVHWDLGILYLTKAMQSLIIPLCFVGLLELQAFTKTERSSDMHPVCMMMTSLPLIN